MHANPSAQGGVFGSLMGTPIINLPQTGECSIYFDSRRLLLTFSLAVLGLHAIKDKPVAVNGKIEIRPVRFPFRGASSANHANFGANR